MISSTDSHPATGIREGHREMLATLREFTRGLEGTSEPEQLRALVAFLRQGLLPFTQWEERHLAGCAVITEDAAFEHAFLAAEIDALATAVASAAHENGGSRSGITPGIRRQVHRIEALLELHVQKAEDRASLFASPDTETDAGASRSSVHEMDTAELHRFLRRHEWGILSTVGQGVPYAVPVSYGFDGRFVYVASGPGRKRHNLESGRAACVTVAEVEDGDRWSSVLVIGEALPVGDLRGRLHAIEAIRRQRSQGGPPSVGDLARVARAAIFRIAPDEMTGRVRGETHRRRHVGDVSLPSSCLPAPPASQREERHLGTTG